MNKTRNILVLLAALSALLLVACGDAVVEVARGATSFPTKRQTTGRPSSSPTASKTPTTGAPTTRPTSAVENIPSPVTELFRFEDNMHPFTCKQTAIEVTGRKVNETLDRLNIQVSADGNVAVVRAGSPIGDDDYGDSGFEDSVILVIRRPSPGKSFSVVQRIPFHTTKDKQLINSGLEPKFSLAISGDGSTVAVGTAYCGQDTSDACNATINPIDAFGGIRVFTLDVRTGKYVVGASTLRVKRGVDNELYDQGMYIFMSYNGQTIFTGATQSGESIDTIWGWRKIGNQWVSQGMVNNAATENCPNGDVIPWTVGFSRDGTMAVIICGEEYTENGIVLQFKNGAWKFDGSIAFLPNKDYIRIQSVDFVSNDKFIVNANVNSGLINYFDSTWFYTRNATANSENKWALTLMVPSTISPEVVKYGPEPVVLLSFRDWAATGVFTTSGQKWKQTYTYQRVVDAKGTFAPDFVVYSTTLFFGAPRQGMDPASWVCPDLPTTAQ